MYFFFPQNIIKVVPIIVGNLYEKLSRKKSVIKLSFYKFYSSISCRHIACNLLIPNFSSYTYSLKLYVTFRTFFGSYYLCNKICKEQSDYSLLPDKNAIMYRSSRLEVFCRRVVLKNFAKFT